MNQLLHIHSFGYAANNNPLRAVRGGEEFGEIIPAPNWHEEIVKRNASVDQTVAEMQKVIRESAWQTKLLSQRLLGKDLYTTCENIWNFLFSHILYKEDDKGQEQLRTPALSWYLRKIRGIDCDDFSIFASTILYNLNIPHYLRIARYAGVDHFQHVYVVVPQKGRDYITIDAVLDEYDAEKPTAEIKDFLMMNKTNLNGIDVSVLSGIDDDTVNREVSGILSGIDFEHLGELENLEDLEGIDDLEGLGEAEGDAILGAIKSHLQRTRRAVTQNPELISTVEDPQMFGEMLDYSLRYWDTDKREQALGILADKEDEINRLLGLENLSNEEAQLFYGIEGLGGVSVLGKAKAKKQFFNNVKKTVNKVTSSVKRTAQSAGAGIKKTARNTAAKTKKAAAKAKTVAKKVGKQVVKNNPVSVSARLGLLAAMKTNFLKIASKLKWGYLTESEAADHGFDMAEWQKSKTALTKAEHLFVDTLKGKASEFKKAILTGRAGGLSGINEELGVVTAAAATASMTAATPFIKQLVELVKAINPAKLIAKVKAKKLAKQAKKADTIPEPPEDAKSAQPDADDTPPEIPQDDDDKDAPADDPAPDTKVDEDKELESKTPEPTGDPKPGASGQDPPDSATSPSGGSSLTTNAPIKLDADANTAPLPTGKSAGEESNPIMKIVDWVKENPYKTALVVGGLVLAFTPARKVIGFGKVSRKGKPKKGKNKKNPPKAISGIGKKPKPAKTKKRGSKPGRKPRGGNGHPPTVTL